MSQDARLAAPHGFPSRYLSPMKLLPTCLALTIATVGGIVDIDPAGADPLPKVGETLGENPAPWPKMDWLYPAPSANEAAGKVIVHWFCAPKIAACTDELERMVSLRDHGKVYVIAHINGTRKDALKLDPIRGSEGVGRGTVAFGKGVTALMKAMAITGPASVVIGVNGKVELVTSTSSSVDLELRDSKIAALVATIKDYVSSADGPTLLKVGEKFNLSMTVKLASWLRYSTKSPMEFKLTAPSDIKCDALKLTGDQLKIEGDKLVAQVSCTGAKGSYELRGDLRFAYDTLSGGQGLGQDGATWKLSIIPQGGLGAK